MAFPSLSQLITDIEDTVATTESDVQSWVAQIQAGVAVLEKDLGYGLAWVASEAPVWVTGLQTALALAQAIPGLQIPASVVLAITEAAAALNAVAASVNAGKTSGATLVAAYGAVVAAKSAQAAVLHTVTSAPTPAPAA
jgi:hypothetical protein